MFTEKREREGEKPSNPLGGGGGNNVAPITLGCVDTLCGGKSLITVAVIPMNHFLFNIQTAQESHFHPLERDKKHFEGGGKDG